MFKSENVKAALISLLSESIKIYDIEILIETDEYVMFRNGTMLIKPMAHIRYFNDPQRNFSSVESILKRFTQ